MKKRAVAPTKGRPGRPATFAREDAVVAAMNLFWKKGFLAVSASDLSAAMNIQRSSFYNAFANREAVFREALHRYGEIAPDAPLERLQPGEAAVPVLVSVMRDICRVRASDADARGCLVCNGIAELVGVDATIGPLLEDGVEHRIETVAMLLRQAIRQGAIPPPADTEAAARAVVAFLIGLNTLSKIVRSEAQLWSMCCQFLSGLGISRDALDAANVVSRKA